MSGSNVYPQSMFWSKYENITIFHLKNISFLQQWNITVYYIGVFS